MGVLGFHVLAVVVLIQASPISEPEDGPQARAVKVVLEKYTRACNSKDLDSISQVFSHDPDIVLMGTYLPTRCVGWNNVAAWYKELFSSSGKFTIQHRNIEIKVLPSGSSAFLLCDQDGNGNYKGKEYSFEGVRTTWVLVKQKGQWRVVHAHWSLPADPNQTANSAPRSD